MGMVVCCLGSMSIAVLLALHFLLFELVRIYNWNGQRYELVGRVRLRCENDTYVINITERIADLSRTTKYCLVPARQFVRKKRYQKLVVWAGASEVFLPVEERMRYCIYYRAEGKRQQFHAHKKMCLQYSPLQNLLL